MTDDCQTRSSPQPGGRDKLISKGEAGADGLQQPVARRLKVEMLVCLFYTSTVEGGKAPENNPNTESDEIKHTSDVSGFSSF